jgi:hypothetical protein
VNTDYTVRAASPSTPGRSAPAPAPAPAPASPTPAPIPVSPAGPTTVIVPGSVDPAVVLPPAAEPAGTHAAPAATESDDTVEAANRERTDASATAPAGSADPAEETTDQGLAERLRSPWVAGALLAAVVSAGLLVLVTRRSRDRGTDGELDLAAV